MVHLICTSYAGSHVTRNIHYKSYLNDPGYLDRQMMPKINVTGCKPHP